MLLSIFQVEPDVLIQETAEHVMENPGYLVNSTLYNKLKEFVITEIIAFAPYRIGGLERLKISTLLEAM